MQHSAVMMGTSMTHYQSDVLNMSGDVKQVTTTLRHLVSSQRQIRVTALFGDINACYNDRCVKRLHKYVLHHGAIYSAKLCTF